MKRTLAALVLVASASGCRVLAHSFERETVEHRTVQSREVLSENWGAVGAPAIVAVPQPGGLRLTATGRQAGTQRVHVRETVRIEERCARRAVAGIFEAPDSFLAVCDDVWVCFSFLGCFLFSHTDSETDPRLVAAFFVLGVVPMMVDVVTFIPWWIAGHDWAGPCDFVSDSHEAPDIDEDRDETVERDAPLAGAEIVARRKGDPSAWGRVSCGADGTAIVPLRELVAWSKGSSAPLVFEVASGGQVAQAEVSPGAVLNGPDGSAVDWRAPRTSLSPQLAAASRLEGSTLVVTIENRGSGDAWQVAAVVASDDASADGRVAAFGHVRPGERVEARVALPKGVTRGAIDFSEAWGHAPAAAPFGE